MSVIAKPGVKLEIPDGAVIANKVFPQNICTLVFTTEFSFGAKLIIFEFLCAGN